LKGEADPLESRIASVADAFDALSSRRLYKPAYPIGQCLKMLSEGCGTQLDPAVVDALRHRSENFAHIAADQADPEVLAAAA
jgi:putative two-component system response regulator